MTKTLTPEAFVASMKSDLMNGTFSGPTIVGVRGEETILAVLDPSMPTVAMRCQALRIVGADLIESFAQSGPKPIERVMIARETWMSKQEEVPPSEDPNRTEGLTISVADFSKGENYVLLLEVVRNGEVIDLVLRRKISAKDCMDKNMQALMSGMIVRLKGQKPDSAGLHVHRIDLTKSKDPGSKQQN